MATNSKTLFFFGYSQTCFLRVSKTGRWLKVECKGSYFEYEKNYQGITCSEATKDLLDYVKKNTGTTFRSTRLTQENAKRVLDEMEKKQLTLFS